MMVNCRECGNEVSSEAKTCPKCGAVPVKRTSAAAWLLAIVGAIGLGLFAINVFVSEDTKRANAFFRMCRDELVIAGAATMEECLTKAEKLKRGESILDKR